MLFFLTYHAKMGCVKITLIGVYLRGSIVKKRSVMTILPDCQ